jgi:putative ABC transport system permease protein
MLALVFGAVRARTAQALAVLVLTALIAATAAAGPWYVLAASSRAADGDVAAAPASERTLSIRKLATTGGDPEGALEGFAGTVRDMLPLPGLQPTLGMTLSLTAQRSDAKPSMAVSYRDDFCEHVRFTGSCPSAAGEAAISEDAAGRLGLDIGDKLVLQASELTVPVELKVVARYVVADPTGTYWTNKLFRADGGLEPAFTVLGTFTDEQLVEPTLTYDVPLPEALIRGDGGYDLAGVLGRADDEFGDAGLRLVDPTVDLLATIATDRRTIRDGILIALCQVLVLGLFAIGLAGRYTGRDRRGDAALLKLRGSTRWGMLRLALGQHLVPLLAGALVGAPIGLFGARLIAGTIRSQSDRTLGLELAVAAVAAVIVCGLLVLLAVEVAVLRLPVAVLLRRVSPGRRNWKADVVDLVLVAVAVAAVYQTRAGAGGGLALVAPALVALAAALLLARLLSWIADRVGGVALRAGRLRLGLTAAQVARRPGADRVFALLAVAVAIFASSAGVWSAGRDARTERSEAELGAQRVLTVQAANRTALQDAVRRADPGGEQAMAAVIDRESVPPVVAVDSSRLAAIAHWRPEYGPVTTIGTAVRSVPLQATPMVTGDRLTLRAAVTGSAPIIVTAVLQNEATGSSHSVAFGPLRKGRHTVGAPVTGCAGEPGCRLVRWEVTTPSDASGKGAPPPRGSVVTIRGLTQQGPEGEVLDGDALGDVRRWRPDFTGAALDIVAGSGGLRIAADRNEGGAPLVGNRVYTVDAPLPLPIVMSGAAPTAWQFTDPVVYAFGGSAVPVRVAATAPVLPVVGRNGVLVDLDAARRVAAEGDLGGTFQVWLAADAPESVLSALRESGLTVLGDDSVAARRDELGGQGTSVGVLFALLAALVGLLLAAAAVAVVAAVEREGQADQLRSLRTQGLARGTAVSIAYAGSAALVLAGLLAGLLAAVLARPIAGVTVRPFTDSWDLIPPPGALRPLVLLLTGLLALVVLGVTSWLSVLPLVRKLRGGAR